MKRILLTLGLVFALLVPGTAFAGDGPYSVKESSDKGVWYVVDAEGDQHGHAHTTEGSATRAANKMNREYKKKNKEESGGDGER